MFAQKQSVIPHQLSLQKTNSYCCDQQDAIPLQTKQLQAGVQKSEISVMGLLITSNFEGPLCLPFYNLSDFKFGAFIHV